MSRSPHGNVVWSLKRYTNEVDVWDRVCGQCKQQMPVFEYEQHDEQVRSHLGYLCEECAQKLLVQWLYGVPPASAEARDFQTRFDMATVYYEQKNDGETLLLTRWSTEQRRRRLQGEKE